MSDYQIEHLQKVPIYFLLFSYYSYTTTLPIQKQKYSFMHHIFKKGILKLPIYQVSWDTKAGFAISHSSTRARTYNHLEPKGAGEESSSQKLHI